MLGFLSALMVLCVRSSIRSEFFVLFSDFASIFTAAAFIFSTVPLEIVKSPVTVTAVAFDVLLLLSDKILLKILFVHLVHLSSTEQEVEVRLKVCKT